MSSGPSCPICKSSSATPIRRTSFIGQLAARQAVQAYRCENGHAWIVAKAEDDPLEMRDSAA
jgi:hypothetical protein